MPKAQGNHAEGKPAPCAGWLRDQRSVKGCLTLDGIVAGMAAVHGVTVHRGSVGTSLQRPGLSHENTPLASEILRPEVAEVAGRHGSKSSSLTWPTCWKGLSSSTTLRSAQAKIRSRPTTVKTTGWATVGKRLIDHAPFGHRHTRTPRHRGAQALHRGPLLRRADCALGAWRRDEPRQPGRLAPRPAPPRPGPQAWSNRCGRQPVVPDVWPRRRAPARPRQRRDLPAARLARPEPGRDGFLQTENPDPKSRRHNLRSPVKKGRCRLRPVPPPGMPKLLRRSRVWFKLNASCSRAKRNVSTTLRHLGFEFRLGLALFALVG